MISPSSSTATENRPAAARLVTDPGAVPFVDLSVGNFGEIVSGARSLSATGSWVVRTPFGFFVHGYEQARSILRDQSWISVLAGADVGELLAQTNTGDNALERPQLEPRPNVLTVEGDDHRRLRKLVSSAFTPASADQLRPFMAGHAKQLLEAICAAHESATEPNTNSPTSELVNDLCRPYPIPIICELLGAPAADWEQFDRWAETILGALDADAEALMSRMDEIVKARAELDAYVSELVEQRRNQPGEDLLSHLIAVHGEDNDQLLTDELAGMVEALLLAGTDTTRNQLGATLAALADHPDQYEILRKQPELVPAAIEESLRYLGAVRSTARLATRDIEVEGLVFPAGTTVAVGLHAASLSAENEKACPVTGTSVTSSVTSNEPPTSNVEAADSYRFDITASRERPHLAFGSGIHHCLGAFLARAELQEALTQFVARVEAFELTEPVEWKPLSMGIWGPTRMKVRFTEKRRSSPNRFTAGTTAPPATITTEPSTVASSTQEKEHDRYLADVAPMRSQIRSELPALLKPRRIPPLGRLAVTAARIGWAVFVGRAFDQLTNRLFKRGPRAKNPGAEQLRSRTYRRLRKAAEKLGPSYIKLAQLIAAGEGVFPDALVAECRACRDRVTAEPWHRIRRVLEAELGPLHRRFASIEPTPIAAASIAQAHAATLLDGTEVVVKVQRPNIQRRVVKDITVLAWVAPRLVGRIPITALTNPPALVELFAETISEELDFRVEVANMIEVGRTLRARSSNQPAWKVPSPHLDAVTKRVIVMSRVGGRPLSALGPDDIEPQLANSIFRQMTDSLLEGTCVHGVFHGDFHAGNVFVDEHGSIGLVDFGITGWLEGHRRVAFLRYVMGLLTGDVAAQLEGMAQLGAFAPGVDSAKLVTELGLDRPDFDPLRLSKEEFVSEFRALISGLLKNGARIPKELMLFIKNFAYITSVMGELEPDMDILAQFERTASTFVARNGVRMAGEIGYAVTPEDVTEAALRQAMGVSSQEPKVTWRLLRRRRGELTERISNAPANSLS